MICSTLCFDVSTSTGRYWVHLFLPPWGVLGEVLAHRLQNLGRRGLPRGTLRLGVRVYTEKAVDCYGTHGGPVTLIILDFELRQL